MSLHIVQHCPIYSATLHERISHAHVPSPYACLLGGGTVIAATAAGGAFLSTRTPVSALAPWQAAGDYDDPRLRALSYALLAPNPHNRQPWLVDASGEDRVRILRDPAKRLPETDPLDRQITIGMGCFLELMIMAAGEGGHGVTLDLFPEGPDGPVADAVFVPGEGMPDPLFAAALNRRSCKEPFDMRAPAPEAMAAVAKEATVIVDPNRVAALRDLTWEAWLVEARTPHTQRESVDLMRIGRREIEANPDGIDLGGPFLESLALFGMLSREGQADPDSFEVAEGIRMYEEMLAATPAYAVLTTPSDTPEDRIMAGRAWVRANLAATRAGLSFHPVSQALQEYPEMRVHHARAHAMLASDGGTVQMLSRLGYGPAVPPSPRWPLEAKIVDA